MVTTYIVPITFPDLDTAKHDAQTLVEALRTAGLRAELLPAPSLDAQGDAGRPDPGQTKVELQMQAADPDVLRDSVQQVMDGQFPPGMLLLGHPAPA